MARNIFPRNVQNVLCVQTVAASMYHRLFESNNSSSNSLGDSVGPKTIFAVSDVAERVSERASGQRRDFDEDGGSSSGVVTDRSAAARRGKSSGNCARRRRLLPPPPSSLSSQPQLGHGGGGTGAPNSPGIYLCAAHLKTAAAAAGQNRHSPQGHRLVNLGKG